MATFLRLRDLSWLLLAASCASGGRTAPEERVFFPPPPDPPRIQFLMAIADGRDLEGGPSGLDRILFGEQGGVRKPLVRPFGVVYHEGQVFVTDTRLGVVIVVDLRRKKVDLAPIKGRGRTTKPMAVDVGPEGRIYVADAGRRQVVVYDRDWKYLAEWGPFEKGSVPIDVRAVGERVYVVDGMRSGGCVRVLDRRTGKQLFVLGRKADRREFLRAPTSVDVDENGNVFVVDTIFCRVYVWDKDGHFIRHIGEPGDVVGQFGRPKGIACDGRVVYVLDNAFENCQLFDFAGRPLMFFGGSGVKPGLMYMPAHLWVGSEGLEYFKDRLDPDFRAEKLIIVTNQFGPNKLAFYALGRHRKFKYEDVELPAAPIPEPAEPKGGPPGRRSLHGKPGSAGESSGGRGGRREADGGGR